jgi:hypothetical protein
MAPFGPMALKSVWGKLFSSLVQWREVPEGARLWPYPFWLITLGIFAAAPNR